MNDGKVSFKEFLMTRIWHQRERPWVWWLLLALIYLKL